MFRIALLALLALAAAPQDEPRPGLVAEYYDTARGLSDFPKPENPPWLFLRRIEPGICHEPTDGTFADSKIAEHFYAHWTGFIRIPKEGDWTFYLDSDDGSRLWIDGQKVVENGGPHGMVEKSSTVNLKAGDHPIVVDYFDQGGQAGLRFSWSSPDRAKEIVPAEFFFHAKDDLDRAAAAEDLKLRWKLDADQFARYRVYAAENGAFNHDPHLEPGVFGYDLDEKRIYHPELQVVHEVPFILGFTLPERALHSGRAIDLDMMLDRGWDYEPARAKGKIERSKPAPGGLVSYAITAKLVGLKGKAEGRQNRIKESAYDAEVDFDPDRGVVTRLRFNFTITFEGGKPTTVTREARLVDVVKRRHAAFETEVNRAIDRGVERVWASYDEKVSHWGAHGDYKEGPTALALLTILKGSLDRKDARIDRALKWYLDQPLFFVYSVALGMMAVEAYYSPSDPSRRFKPGEVADKDIASKISPEHKKWMEQAAGWIISNQRDNYWAYPDGTQDYSNTQYGVLGLLAAQRCGVIIPDKPLVNVVSRILQSQEIKGPAVKLALLDDAPGGTVAEHSVMALGWGYRERPEAHDGPRASMTAGVVGTLAILDAMLTKMGSTRYKPELREKVRASMRGGWAWLAHHWALMQNYNCGRSWHYYALYALERAGMLGGVSSVNSHDWYWEGASWLIVHQATDGAWCDRGNVWLHDICFGVLFLKRATIRVMTGDKK